MSVDIKNYLKFKNSTFEKIVTEKGGTGSRRSRRTVPHYLTIATKVRQIMYNLKIIEYPNGSAQIRIYSKIIGLGGGDPPEQQWEIEPFTHTKVRVIDDFDRIEVT